MSKFPDREKYVLDLEINEDQSRILRRLLNISREWYDTYIEHTEGGDVVPNELFPLPVVIDDELAKLNTEARLLRRQIKLIDDYDTEFGDKEEARDPDGEAELQVG